MRWTATDTNKSIIAGGLQSLHFNLVHSGDAGATRLRGFDNIRNWLPGMGATVDYGLVWRSPSRKCTCLSWILIPCEDSFVSQLEKHTTFCRENNVWNECCIVDIHFPWKHLERAFGSPEGFWTDERISTLERGMRAADIVTTPFEEIIPEIEQLNPNVVYVPDFDEDSPEGWLTGYLALMTLFNKISMERSAKRNANKEAKR